MTKPIFVVGINFIHADRWSRDVVLSGIKPINVSPSNVDFVFRGQRDCVIIILKDAYIPLDTIAIIRRWNTIINLNLE